MSDTFSLILEEFSNANDSMEVLFQKRAEGLWPPVRFSGPAFFFSRCASTFDIRTPENLGNFVLDAYNVAIIPAEMHLQLSGGSAVSDGVFLSPKPALIESAVEEGVDLNEQMKAVGSLVVLPRTNWLNEIMHRYVFERVVLGRQNSKATAFLEVEIVKEIYYRFEESSRRDKSRFDLDSRFFDQRTPVLRAAMAFIDANLFRDIGIDDLVKKVGVSESSLLREFKNGLGKSPIAYIVDRRLEEALVLLKSQRYNVGQISDIVGYENVSTFSAAFKKRYGITPSQVVAKDLSKTTK